MKLTKSKLKQIIKEELRFSSSLNDDEVFAITRASSKAERAGWRSDEFDHFKDLVMNAIERAVPEASDEALESIAQNMRAHLENLSADLRGKPGGLMGGLTREWLGNLAKELARISPQLELPINENSRKAAMKLTKSKLKQIIKEELAKALNENQSEPFTVTHEDYGNSATFQFNGFNTPHDMTIASFKIKLDDGQMIETDKMPAGLDTEDMAQNLAEVIFNNSKDYWFLDPGYNDGPDYKKFVGALKNSLDAKGIDPESESEARNSYRDRDGGGGF
jgi:hypothetical protein